MVTRPTVAESGNASQSLQGNFCDFIIKLFFRIIPKFIPCLLMPNIFSKRLWVKKKMRYVKKHKKRGEVRALA
jgi:hypothetical protein